jgi:hypothetical protein
MDFQPEMSYTPKGDQMRARSTRAALRDRLGQYLTHGQPHGPSNALIAPTVGQHKPVNPFPGRIGFLTTAQSVRHLPAARRPIPATRQFFGQKKTIYLCFDE